MPQKSSRDTNPLLLPTKSPRWAFKQIRLCHPEFACSCWWEIRFMGKQKLIGSITGYWDGALQPKSWKAFQSGAILRLARCLACSQMEMEVGMGLKKSAWELFETCHSRARLRREQVALACFLNWGLTCTTLFPQHWNLLKVTLARLSFCHDRLDQMISEVPPTWDSVIRQLSSSPIYRNHFGNPITSSCLRVSTTTNSSEGIKKQQPQTFFILQPLSTHQYQNALQTLSYLSQMSPWGPRGSHYYWSTLPCSEGWRSRPEAAPHDAWTPQDLLSPCRTPLTPCPWYRRQGRRGYNWHHVCMGLAVLESTQGTKYLWKNEIILKKKLKIAFSFPAQERGLCNSITKCTYVVRHRLNIASNYENMNNCSA